MRSYNYSQDELDINLARCGVDVRIATSVIIKRPELFSVGNHVAIDDYCVFTTQVELGDYIHIAPLCSVIGGRDSLFRMDHFTTISAGCRIVCASDEFKGAGLVSTVIPEQYRDTVLTGGVWLKAFASIASNCVISPGVVLGQGAVIGANSFVKADTWIAPWQIWAGSPARFIGWRENGEMIRYAIAMGYGKDDKEL